MKSFSIYVERQNTRSGSSIKSYDHESKEELDDLIDTDFKPEQISIIISMLGREELDVRNLEKLVNKFKTDDNVYDKINQELKRFSKILK